MKGTEIVAKLPYRRPFLFVDGITQVSEQSICGQYTFRPDEFFYAGHFIGHPVTPGVILLECMAQIGLVAHGIYLLNQAGKELPQQVAFSSSEVDFLLPVYPGELVHVQTELQYFRLGKIKSRVELRGKNGVACRGILSGMMK